MVKYSKENEKWIKEKTNDANPGADFIANDKYNHQLGRRESSTSEAIPLDSGINGKLGGPNGGEVSIDVPEKILIDDADDPIASIIDFTYANILDNIHDPALFQEKAILAPTNKIVDTINDHLLAKFPGEEMV
ncbi:hypothetical protein CTI12_AA025470 [Artemisia annua]|uniref:Uncharacterized protein n=1 Tax=Artemisia annua TaxID=35608 RepID=A0A2U1QH55_ARTAN|nr:hypothetical protein CTI12_AA025470 [Artemisia annua]